MPPLRAVRAAPTVPEWYTARPTLAPGLMPDTTRSIGPKRPKRANIVHSAGGPLMVHASSMPSSAVRRAWGWIRCSGPRAAPAPEYSVSGATTTTSPWRRIVRASTCSPMDEMPSSFVTMMRTGWFLPDCSLVHQRSVRRADAARCTNEPKTVFDGSLARRLAPSRRRTPATLRAAMNSPYTARVGVVGAGYVGLTTAAALAHLGHRVVCADLLPERIARLQRGDIPIVEAGL